MRDLRPERVATRSQGGKTLSYLEAWDVRSHLIRVFGFCNFDVEVLEYDHITTREYETKDNKPMVEVVYSARVRLTLRDEDGGHLATYSEAAVGSTSGPPNMLGEHHDNSVKTAASDALKRCCINLGTQFGLSLYDDGSRRDVVKMTLVPGGQATPQVVPTEDQAKVLAEALGATIEESAAPSDTEVAVARARAAVGEAAQ